MDDKRAAMQRFFEIPKLVTAFAEEVESLHSFTQTCRLAHAVGTPILFRDICILSERMAPLVRALQCRPSLFMHCQSLHLASKDFEIHMRGEDDGEPTAAQIEQPYADIEQFLRQIAEHGTLREFKWTWNIFGTGREPVPSSVWDALSANASSLTSIGLTFASAEQATWQGFPWSQFTRLHDLKLRLVDAHGWDCSNLHIMLQKQADLRTLELVFPICCGQDTFSLASTHPHLHTFTLVSSKLEERAAGSVDPTSGFLQRHPNIVTLSLGSAPTFTLAGDDLPRLRALRVDGVNMLRNSAAFSHAIRNRPVAYLRLDLLGPILTRGFSMTTDICLNFNKTLRYLHLDMGIDHFRVSLGMYFSVLQRVPRLEELRIGASFLSSNDLRDFLIDLDQDPDCAPSLKALSFVDPHAGPLSANVLEDLSPIPVYLEYLGWQATLYRLTELGGRMTAAEVPHRRGRGDDWTKQSILDFSPLLQHSL